MTDCVNKGGINPIAFPILTIFYCQQWTSILKIDAFGVSKLKRVLYCSFVY